MASRLITLLLLLCWGWAGARLLGGDRIPVLAGLLVPGFAFTPYAGLVAIAVVVWAAALRRWKAVAAGLAAVVAFAAAVLPRATGDEAPAAGGPVLRVLTANLHFGRADARALVDLVRRERVDVLSLQEFTTATASGLEAAGLHTVLPYRVTAPPGGAPGSGLYARHALRRLPMPAEDEAGRAMPRAEMEVPGRGRIEIMAVHLARPVNRSGIGQWLRGFTLLPAPGGHEPVRILAGDFNATLDHARVRGLTSGGYTDAADATGSGLAPTFRTSAWPPITVDHVLVDRRCAVRHVRVHHLANTDHRAVLAELRLP
ncbi:MAG: Endonuclease/exonuclease/phosphatase [Streptosporangiaceae bacterium]|nr:Endonuclease/exonuclease/phosphatase [Streptosporangiaceae bacterium]